MSTLNFLWAIVGVACMAACVACVIVCRRAMRLVSTKLAQFNAARLPADDAQAQVAQSEMPGSRWPDPLDKGLPR